MISYPELILVSAAAIAKLDPANVIVVLYLINKTMLKKSDYEGIGDKFCQN